MNITFKSIPVTLQKDIIKVGEELSFSATNPDFSSFKLENNNRVKLISLFPSIDTSVCDLQTKKIAELAAKYNHIDFISISLDLPPAIKKWCHANLMDNLIIVSDYKDREFGMRTGLLINELKLLARGLILLDKNNVVKYIDICSEVADMPDFDKIERIL
jgi:thioredoxin-dependent peroxiredoxin